MIVEYIRYAVPHDRQDQFVTNYRTAIDVLAKSPHCLSADLSRCTEDPLKFIVRIEWTSAEDHMEKFRNSHTFREFFPLVRPYVGMIEEMRHYEQLAYVQRLPG